MFSLGLALNERKQRLKELERSIQLGEQLGLAEEEITEIKRELLALMRSSAVDKAVLGKADVDKAVDKADVDKAVDKADVDKAVDKADVDKAVAEKTAVQGELCCCGCNKNVAESIHFCTKTNRRMLAFCAASGGRT